MSNKPVSATEVASNTLTLSINAEDLEYMAKSLEKSLVTAQMELVEAENKVNHLKVEVSKTAGFLNVMRAQLNKPKFDK